MTIKGFKFAPVAWMTTALAVVTGLITLDASVHILPVGATPWLTAAAGVLTVVLGVLAHGRVTPTAAPQDDAGNRLVPASMAPPAGNPTSPIAQAGMQSWRERPGGPRASD